jgi:hypothetical protein
MGAAVIATGLLTVMGGHPNRAPDSTPPPIIGTVSVSPEPSASRAPSPPRASPTPAATRPSSTHPSPVPATSAIDDMTALIGNVRQATAYRYGLRDSSGASMDTLKVIANPSGGYLGVYHTSLGSAFAVRVATSSDLVTWTLRATLDSHASQPTIAATSDGGLLVVEEADNTGLASPSATWLRFLHYPSLARLLSSAPDARFDAPHTLVAPIPEGGAEGTPNVYSVTLSPDVGHSVIEIGFHYFKDAVVDRQARGTLTNFRAWSTRAQPAIDAALEALGCKGNIGDRDSLVYEGVRLNIHEGQLVQNDWSAWRVFLYQPVTGEARRLAVATRGGSRSFANPSFSWVILPSGKRAIVVTMFIPVAGSAPGEAGELLYYREVQ